MIAKICGITRLADARHAVQHGATALGFVFWPDSPRFIRPEDAGSIVRELPQGIEAVGVFVNQPAEEIVRIVATARLTTIQLHGDEVPAHAATLDRPVWRALALESLNGSLAEWPVDTTIVLDAHDPVRRGGTGRAIDWVRAAEVARQRRVILAGGLTPENVQDAIAAVRPFGVDVSSGVEETPGVKSFDKVARFLERARAACHDH